VISQKGQDLSIIPKVTHRLPITQYQAALQESSLNMTFDSDTIQVQAFSVREAAETRTALPAVTAVWTSDLKSLLVSRLDCFWYLPALTPLRTTLAGASKYALSYSFFGPREVLCRVVHDLDNDETKESFRLCESHC
jgi:hypothetical protein